MSLLSVGVEVFDLIIIDSPPVMGLADAPLLSSATAATIFVAGAGQVRTGLIRNAIKRLQFARGTVIGTVITKFDAKLDVRLPNQRVLLTSARGAYQPNLAYCYEKAGKILAAAGELSRAVRTEPDNEEAGAALLELALRHREARVRAYLALPSIRAAVKGTMSVHSVQGGYGNYVTIDSGDGWMTLYGHLAGFNRGDGPVQVHDLIGREGSTGNSTGCHVHFEVRHRGTPVDPRPLLA